MSKIYEDGQQKDNQRDMMKERMSKPYADEQQKENHRDRMKEHYADQNNRE